MTMRCVTLAITIGLIAVPSGGVARDRSKPAKALGNPGDWFPMDSYPAEAKRKGQQGRVSVQLTIDKTGVPTGCTVVASSGSPSLDKATCDLATANAKYTPALDAKGQPTEATVALPGVRWELSDDRPKKLEGPWRVGATLKIDQAGIVVSCTEQRSGPAPADTQLCLSAKTMPPAFGLFARGTSTAATTELVMEASLSFDGEPAPPMTYDMSGREMLNMNVIHYDVDTDGKTSNCQIEAQSGPNPDNLCTSSPGPFLPIDKPRHIVIKFAMSRPAAQ